MWTFTVLRVFLLLEPQGPQHAQSHINWDMGGQFCLLFVCFLMGRQFCFVVREFQRCSYVVYVWLVFFFFFWVQDGLKWLLNYPEQNIPLILADNGFDVWISNTRGTRLSRRHVSLVPSQPVLFLFPFTTHQFNYFIKLFCAAYDDS